MQPSEIKALLEANITGSQVEVSSDGSHVTIKVVSSVFKVCAQFKSSS